MTGRTDGAGGSESEYEHEHDHDNESEYEYESEGGSGSDLAHRRREAARLAYVVVDGRDGEVLNGNLRRLTTEPRRTAVVRGLLADAARITPEDLDALLGPGSGWRERIVAAWLAGIGGHAGQRARLGELLVAGEQVYAGQGYCFALACLGTAADAGILTAYLDRYLPARERFHAQEWALSALIDLDSRLGTGHAGRFTAPGGLWWSWTRDASAGHLATVSRRVTDLRTLIDRVRATPAAAVRDPFPQPADLPPGWHVIAPEDRAACAAEAAVEMDPAGEDPHPLAGLPLTPLALCTCRTRLLAELPGDPARWALLGLTWSGRPEPDPWAGWTVSASPVTALGELAEHDCES